MYSQIHRLFFALRPDETTRQEIQNVATTLKTAKIVRGNWLKAEAYHITLHFLGDHAVLPADLVAQAMDAAQSLAYASFEISLDRMVSFRGRRQSPCILRCAPDCEHELQAFWQHLGSALTIAGLGEHVERRFTPHLTLAYGEKMLAEPMPISPIVWPVRKFALIDSHVGRSKHDLLGSWTLKG